MDKIDIDELREELKNYYGSAAVVLRNDTPFEFVPPLSELYEVDDMSNEEIVEEAKRLGILQIHII